MSIIYHIAHGHEWQAAKAAGSYRTESLDSQGFIHCSKAEQVLRVANNFYRGQAGLVVLVIETDKVHAEVRFEPPVHPKTGTMATETEETFPHIYGAINIDAVVNVLDLPPNADGSFTLPEAIESS